MACKSDKEFGAIVKRKRKTIGISQEKLAEIVGLSVVSCRNIEKGECSTNWKTWLKICIVLNIDYSFIAETYIKPEINETGEFLGIKV